MADEDKLSNADLHCISMELDTSVLPQRRCEDEERGGIQRMINGREEQIERVEQARRKRVRELEDQIAHIQQQSRELMTTLDLNQSQSRPSPRLRQAF